MTKQSCCDKINRLIRDALLYGKGDCETDYQTQHSFRSEVKEFLSSAVVDAMPWHQAIDSICFSTCPGPIGGGYDKRLAQEVFADGWNKMNRLLTQLKAKFDSCTDCDVRWAVSYEGGVE